MPPVSTWPSPSSNPTSAMRVVGYGLLETIDQGHLYGSVSEAVEAFRAETGSQWHDPNSNS